MERSSIGFERRKHCERGPKGEAAGETAESTQFMECVGLEFSAREVADRMRPQG